MGLLPVEGCGEYGLMADLDHTNLPLAAWTSGKNVRFFDGKAYSTYGYVSILGTPAVDPYYLFPVVDNAGNVLWAYTGLAKAYVSDGTTQYDITRLAGDYTGTAAALWQGFNFGGITIFNNGVDVPQAWSPPGTGTRLVNLANWPGSTIAKVVKGFRRYLVAYDVTQSGTRRPNLVKWSAQADIGAVPSSWDPTDTTKEAGEWPLQETDGAIIDALALGNVNFIYKSDAIFTMREIGGRFIFAFNRELSNLNILAQRCVAEYKKQHVLATTEDVVIHDGANITSLLSRKFRKWYLGRADATNAFKSFVVINYAEDEAWICIPEQGMAYPNIALTINLKDRQPCGVIELPMPTHIHFGGQTAAAGTGFDSITIPFDAMVGYFGQSDVAINRKRLVASTVSPTKKFFLMDSGFTADGTPFESFLERTGIAAFGIGRGGQLLSSQVIVKLITELFPRVLLQNGSTVEFYVGMQDGSQEGVLWRGPFVYNPADPKIDPLLEGRLIGIRIRAANGTQWELDNYTMEVTQISQF